MLLLLSTNLKTLASMEGNSISFSNDGEYITLTVIDENGTITEIVIPIGVFGVCTSDCGV